MPRFAVTLKKSVEYEATLVVTAASADEAVASAEYESRSACAYHVWRKSLELGPSVGAINHAD